MREDTLLQVKGLSVYDSRYQRTLVNDIHFSLKRHDCIAIVGESGSGKSLLCKSIIGLQSRWLNISGEVQFQRVNLLTLSANQWTAIRGKQIGFVMQDAMSAFDPLYSIGNQITETLSHHFTLSPNELMDRARTLLSNMQLHNIDELWKKYPHQLSGGMLQRVMIALTLASEPVLIVADEPTTSLDCITQYEIIRQFAQWRIEKSTSMIFVTHDLALVRELAQYVVVMKDGHIVEQGITDKIFDAPAHNYTRHLIDTRRRLSQKFNRLIQGMPHVT
ncbi:ABC transporter ATP-binding protein [Budvicia aquatica]|nr:ABC transporter ATP-binding protein [Budvicia aquatica]PHI32713.1 ABC transporter ATP-binding protein [Budvicia aquatica]